MRTAVIATAALVVLGSAGFVVSKHPEWVPAFGQAAPQAGAVSRNGNGVAQAAVQPGGRRGAAVGSQAAVEIGKSRAQSTTTDILSVGSLQSDESVIVSSELAGRIASVAFSEGESVASGAVLVRLDDAISKAELSDSEARMTLAQANFDRAATLSKQGNVSDKTRDEAAAALATSRAALELAKVKLAKLSIQAPFPGVVGLRKVSVGAFVNPGTAIVNLEKIDELKLDFKSPEIFLSQIKVGQDVDIVVDALPGRTFRGRIYAINPMVDVNGRAVQVRAKLANPDLVLRPGLFARVTVKSDLVRTAVFVPESAIVPRGTETVLYAVDEGRAVETKVKLGERRSGEVEIVSGLGANIPVVVAGQHRLRDGSPVEVVAAAAASRT